MLGALFALHVLASIQSWLWLDREIPAIVLHPIAWHVSSRDQPASVWNSLCGGCCNKTFGLLRAGCWPWQDQCLLFSGRDPIPHLHVKGFDAVVVVGSLHHTRKPGQCSIPLDLVDSDGLHALHATRTLEQRALGALHVVECERRSGWGHCGPAQLPVFLPGVPNDDRRRRSVCPTPAQRNGTELQP